LITLIDHRYVQKVGGNVPNLNGYPFKEPDQIADFLFQIDFLSAHHLGRSDFVQYQGDPDLFHSGENMQNKLMWTVNASYRNYLRIS
jgi:hypothetical protein